MDRTIWLWMLTIFIGACSAGNGYNYIKPAKNIANIPPVVNSDGSTKSVYFFADPDSHQSNQKYRPTSYQQSVSQRYTHTQQPRVVYNQVVSQQRPVTYTQTAPQQNHVTYTQTVPQQHSVTYTQTAPQQNHVTYTQTVPQQHSVSYTQTAPQQNHVTYSQPAPQQHTVSYTQRAPQQNIVTYSQPAAQQHSVRQSQPVFQQNTVTYNQPATQHHIASFSQPAPQQNIVTYNQPPTQQHSVSFSQPAPQQNIVTYNQPAPQQNTISYNQPAPQQVQYTNTQASPVAKKELQVIFVKTPGYEAYTEALLKMAKEAIQAQTVVYVLSKEPDVAELTRRFQEIQSTARKMPEVRFIKYKTDDEAVQAQQAIQAQYEKLPGTSNSFGTQIGTTLTVGKETGSILNHSNDATSLTLPLAAGTSSSENDLSAQNFPPFLPTGIDVVPGSSYLPPNQNGK